MCHPLVHRFLLLGTRTPINRNRFLSYALARLHMGVLWRFRIYLKLRPRS